MSFLHRNSESAFKPPLGGLGVVQKGEGTRVNKKITTFEKNYSFMEDIKTHPLYRKHDIDSALNSLWHFYKSHFVTLFIISAAMSLITQYISSTLNIQEFQQLAMSDPAAALETMKREFMVPIIIIMLISLVFTLVIQHYIIYRPLGMSFTDSLVRSMKYFPAFLIMMILMAFLAAFAMIIGILALIIGVFFTALYALVIYLFILPVMMVEGPDIGNTISRSFGLAHKHFWSNMGWSAVMLILVIVISVVLSGIVALPFAGSLFKSVFNKDTAAAVSIAKNPVFIILTGLVGALTTPVLPIFSCVLYFNARAREEDSTKIVVSEEYKPTIDDLYSKPRNPEADN